MIPPLKNASYIGVYVFGERVERRLSRAANRAELFEERLLAIGEQLRLSASIITDCEETVARVETLLSRRRQHCASDSDRQSRRSATLIDMIDVEQARAAHRAQ
jgi:hypothetical protein